MSIAKELFKVASELEDEKTMISIIAQKKKKKDGDDGEEEDEDTDEKLYKVIKKYRQLLTKMVGKVESFDKLKFLIDNKRLRKPDRWWLIAIDKGNGAGELGGLQEFQKHLAFIFRNKLPVSRILRTILDYGVENGYMSLKRMLENDRARVVILREESDDKK